MLNIFMYLFHEQFHVPWTLMVSETDHIFMYLPFVCLLFSSLSAHFYSYCFFGGRVVCFLFCCWFVWVLCVFWILTKPRVRSQQGGGEISKMGHFKASMLYVKLLWVWQLGGIVCSCYSFLILWLELLSQGL